MVESKYYFRVLGAYSGIVGSMECLNCKTSNPDDNRFCGECGAALTEEHSDMGAFLRDELPRQIEQAIDAKLSALMDRELVEHKATEQVTDRVWKWTTRLATVIGIPVAVIVLVLGLWGVDSFRDLEELRKVAEMSLNSAVEKARTIEAKAEIAANNFDSRMKELKELANSANDVASQANETLKSAREIVERYRAKLADMDEKVVEFNRRTRKLYEQLNDVSMQVADTNKLATKTAVLAITAAAEERSEKKVKNLSNSVTAQFLFVEALSKEKFDLKIALYDKAIEIDPKFGEAFNNRGNVFFRNNETDRAIADYNRAVEIDPSYAIAFNNRGNAYGWNNEIKRAIADFDRAIEIDPKFAQAFANRGNAYVRSNETDRAITDYDKAIEIDPSYAIAFNGRGDAYSRKGKYERAITNYNRAIEIDPGYAIAFNNRGNAYSRKGKYERAIADFDRAIEIDPNDATSFNDKAWLLATASSARVRDGQEAVRLAQKAVRLNDKPDYRDTLASAFAEAGQFNDAVAEQERAIEMLRAVNKQDKVADFQSRLHFYRRQQPYRQ